MTSRRTRETASRMLEILRDHVQDDETIRMILRDWRFIDGGTAFQGIVEGMLEILDAGENADDFV